MPGPDSPRAVVERLLDGIARGDWSQLHELYADDAVVEYPFALPAPSRVEGREALRRYFAGVVRLGLELGVRDVTIHETADPEVVVVEYGYDLRAAATGRSARVANIQVTRVRGGLIAESRDFHDHVAMADAVGRLPDVLAARPAAEG